MKRSAALVSAIVCAGCLDRSPYGGPAEFVADHDDSLLVIALLPDGGDVWWILQERVTTTQFAPKTLLASSREPEAAIDLRLNYRFDGQSYLELTQTQSFLLVTNDSGTILIDKESRVQNPYGFPPGPLEIQDGVLYFSRGPEFRRAAIAHDSIVQQTTVTELHFSPVDIIVRNETLFALSLDGSLTSIGLDGYGSVDLPFEGQIEAQRPSLAASTDFVVRQAGDTLTVVRGVDRVVIGEAKLPGLSTAAVAPSGRIALGRQEELYVTHVLDLMPNFERDTVTPAQDIGGSREITAVAIDDNYVYWADGDRSTIYRRRH